MVDADLATSWHSYPKIYNLGHAALAELLLDPVTVEEKVDGSQFSFGVIHGVLRCRSKGQELIVAAPEKMFERASCLGGAKVEGIVVKNYRRFGPDKKALMGKHVGEDFKEVHKAEWSKSNPTRGDVLEELIRVHRTPARWHKAIQHLAERGELETSPRDIGRLIPEVRADIEAECADAIKEALWRWAKPHILRGATAGLPEWYKQRLLEKQFRPASPTHADGSAVEPQEVA